MRTPAYALALLVSAFLLFAVQPMVARFVLPYWGGGSAVWSISMLFFQASLLIGYSYAHIISTHFSVRTGVRLHSALLVLSLAAVSRLGRLSETPTTEIAAPALALLWHLCAHIALPCIVLSASAPLLQQWYANDRGSSAYRLYAVSNTGSLLGLLCYPLVLEPVAGLAMQAKLWSGAYLVFVGLACASAWFARAVPRPQVTTQVPLQVTQGLLWLGLSAAGVALLLSITSDITTNLLPMPLLWVVPLALYLLSFIWCFALNGAYARRRWLALFSLTLLPTLWLPAIAPLIGAWPAVAISCASLFSGCMICHGEIALLKPSANRLSIYYVFLASGGVLGGVLISLVAPLLFDRNWDLSLGLFFVLILAGTCTISASAKQQRRVSGNAVPRGAIALWAIGLAVFALIGTLPLRSQRGTIAVGRSFYGVSSVVDDAHGDRQLLHGRIRHGSQHRGPRSLEPTLYYSQGSGIGMLLEHRAYTAPRRIGVVGLGTGTLASFGRPGDEMRFYELDPLVATFAERHFTFLHESAADVDVIVGDGRWSLQRELQEQGSQGFDVIVIDAFQSDAVPTHLLTREAFSLYQQHMAADGSLLFNTTNAFLNLTPVVVAHAHEQAMQARVVRALPNAHSPAGSTWVLITRNPQLLDDPAFGPAPPPTRNAVWTDDYSNVLGTLR